MEHSCHVVHLCRRLVSVALKLTVGIVGIILCYRVNRSGDNKDFIPRMICLGWPAGVQFVTILSALTIVQGLFSAALGFESLTRIPYRLWTSWGDWFASVLFLTGYYWILYGAIAHVAHPDTAKEAPQAPRKSWSGEEVAIAVLGGIGILVVMGPMLAMGLTLGIPEPFNFIFSGVVILILVWLIFTLLRWERRRQAKSPAYHRSAHRRIP